MDDKPLDLSKKSDSSTTQSEFPSAEKQRPVKERKQITPSNIVISSGGEFSKSVEKTKRTTLQGSMKSIHSQQPNNEFKTPMSENVNPGSCVNNKRKLSAGIDVNSRNKTNSDDEFASNVDIKRKPRVSGDPNRSVRATENYISSRPSTSTDASCSYDPTRIENDSKDRCTFPLVCGYCGKGFNGRSKYDIHVRSHTGEKPFKCEHCEHSCNSLSNLRSHARVHTGEKCFRCQICDMRFSRSDTLLRHNRRHTGERPYICRICDRTFAHKLSLRIHEETHTKNSKEL